jgi:hypothetical protein
LVMVGYSVCGEAKAHTLNAPDEDYLFGNHCLERRISYFVCRIMWPGRGRHATQYGTENSCGFKTILTRYNVPTCLQETLGAGSFRCSEVPHQTAIGLEYRTCVGGRISIVCRDRGGAGNRQSLDK